MAYFLNNLPPVNQYTKTTKEKRLQNIAGAIKQNTTIFLPSLTKPATKAITVNVAMYLRAVIS